MKERRQGVPVDQPDDRDARHAIAHDLDSTFVVEAAAGTGKTTELVKRIVRVLATGKAGVGDLVAVTFTEKAAGELKLRLRQELERRTAPSTGFAANPSTALGASETELDTASRERLDAALMNLEEAHISTIHGFCADLLRERPVEAGIDPLFRVLTEGEARRLYAQAFDAWLQDALQDTPEGVRRSLRRSARPFTSGGEASDDGPVERLKAAGWDLVEWRDFRTAWTRPDFDRHHAITGLVGSVHQFAALTAQATSARDPLFADTAAARRTSDDLRLIMAAGDDDAAEAALVDLCRERDFRRARKGMGASFARGVARADVQSAHQALLLELDAFKADADADLAALLRHELQGSIDRYEHLKAVHGALDFLDLLLRGRDLIRDRADVRAHFQRRFARIFVDEFQDTDPLQAELILLLSADDPSERDSDRVRPVPGKLFVVGDPKQSIYRFRRADVSVYSRVCRQLESHGARCERLTKSFRGVPNLQRCVNAAFAPLMTGDSDTLQASYVPLAKSRDDLNGQPSLIALPVPDPYGKRNISGIAIDASLPDAVGAFVDWLVNESRWQVTERHGAAPVPVKPRHVCLLFRRFVSFGTDMTRGYVDALEARGVNHLLVGGRAFHGREEIETLRAALAAVEWPDDQLSVFAALRGSLFAIGDEELLEYRHRYAKAFHPFRIPPELPAHLQPIGDALRVLATLHERRNRRPVADTISDLFDATRAHVGFALRRAGEQVLANALHVAELARQYEQSGGISFRGFIDALQQAADEGQAGEAPIVEEGSDGVRLMTVHKAKGLEFPVVILADMTAKLVPFEASRYVDHDRGLAAVRIGGWSPKDLTDWSAQEKERERAEGVRIAYVAATRARDVLVVPAIGDQPYGSDGWLSPLDAAIYPSVETRRQPSTASGCPPFKKDSVLRRPDEGVASSQTVAPGGHRLRPAGSASAEPASARPGLQLGRAGLGESGADEADPPFEVVWWDPAALGLGAEPPFGLRRQELISKDVSLDVVAEGTRRYIEWRDARAEACSRGAHPLVDVRTVTEFAKSQLPTSNFQVEIVELPTSEARPSGPRFGTVVHASLAAVPLDADDKTVDRLVTVQARIVGATADEVVAAQRVVRDVLKHPLLAAARRAAESAVLFRETPTTVVRDGQLLEGNVDLAFETDDGFTVIDFKTDRADEDLKAVYARQVQLYAEAIAQATGKPARAVLMNV
jgi:ATP-dependent exoDNAse (exonuclease V) beta subunit